MDRFIQLERKIINQYLDELPTLKQLREMYARLWVHENAEKFRAEWNRSKCKDCSLLENCEKVLLDNELPRACDTFIENNLGKGGAK